MNGIIISLYNRDLASYEIMTENGSLASG